MLYMFFFFLQSKITSFFSVCKKFLFKFFELDGWVFFKTVFIVILIDGLLLDDEPLWEPLEWSVVQTWIFYLFLFSWVAEVVFSSRYGSYTNRDKIVWIGLFKTYYGMLFWFLINMFIVTIFVTLPFYFEITYAISYSVVWWNWISSVFFFRIGSIFTIILALILILRFQTRWLNLNTTKLILLAILVLLTYIFYFNFIVTWFSYFTDPNEFSHSGWSELSWLNNGPLKWGWGSDARDHFSYHKTPTVFWAKNDQLILSSFLFINIFFFYIFFF